MTTTGTTMTGVSEMADPGAASRRVTLPTAPMLGAIWFAAVLAGLAGAGVITMLGRGGQESFGALLGGLLVAVCATVVLLGVRPWTPKPLATWPMIWIAASFVRLAITVAATFLLYSATRFGAVSLVLTVVAAYFAVQVGETRMYAIAMKRHAPDSAAGDASLNDVREFTDP